MLPPMMGGQEYGPPVPSDYVPPPGSQTPAGGAYGVENVPGYPSAPGGLGAPDPENYWFVDLGGGAIVPSKRGDPGAFWSESAYTGAMLDYQKYIQSQADLAAGPGGSGPTPEELAIDWAQVGVQREGVEVQREGMQAQNMATYVSATIAAVDSEIAAGRLSLEQAQAEFDRRLDAFTAAGTQRAEMWQWTVPEGSAGQPLHPDIRGSLGMKPWISRPTTINPFAEAMQIVAESPEISSTPISTDPLDEAVKFLGQYV